MKLNFERRCKKRLPDRIRDAAGQSGRDKSNLVGGFLANARWSGRRFRTFNVLDDSNRDSLRIEIDTSMPAARVVRALTELVEVRGNLVRIRLDNGLEFIRHELARWASEQNITLQFIQKGKPTQNAYVERFNRMYCNSVLDCYVFMFLLILNVRLSNDSTPLLNIGRDETTKFTGRQEGYIPAFIYE